MLPRLTNLKQLTLTLGLPLLALSAESQPSLQSTYIGGSQQEGNNDHVGFEAALDPWGNVFAVGMTESSDFPTTDNAYDRDHKGGYDVYIAKVSSDLSTLLASTFLGSSGNEESWSVTCDAEGNVYVSGVTTSSDFPITPGAFRTYRSGSSDGFITKLDNNLTTLLASTYLGGNGGEGRVKMALDSDGNVFVAGTTTSNPFPTTPGCHDNLYGGNQDFFVSKLSGDLTTLLSSTYVGGSQLEVWPSIVIDAANNVLISGSSGSSNYPTSSGAYDMSLNGTAGSGFDNLDVVITRLDNSLSTILASTYVGSAGYEGGQQLTLDNNGNVYVTGHVLSPTYPVTPGVLDEVHSGDEYFVSRFDPDLTDLVASTFFTPGDVGHWSIWSMAHNGYGAMCFTGIAVGSGVHTTSNAFDQTYNGAWDVVIARMSDDLTSISYSSYLGGAGDDGGSALLMAPDGSVYVYGFAGPSGFPVPASGYDDSYNGGVSDAFVARIRLEWFTRITEGPLVTDVGYAMGVSWGDVNGDNLEDVLVSRSSLNDALYINGGGGSFSKVTSDELVTSGGSNGCSLVDVDNDGDLDAYVTVGMHQLLANRYFLNDGDGSFVQITDDVVVTEIGASVSAALADYDGDGFLDLYVADQGTMPPSGPCNNRLYRNLGGGDFERISTGDAVADFTHSNGVYWADYDNDGDQDLFVLKWDAPNLLFRNDAGSFTRVTGAAFLDGLYASSFVWADYDNDGDLDLFETRYSDGGANSLHENLGGGNFVEITDQPVVQDLGWTSGSCWGDFDNDGDLDLYVSNNPPSPPDEPDYLYVNDGHGVFSRLPGADIGVSPGIGAAVATADFDLDGDLDLLLANGYNDYSCELYSNNGNTNNWISIECHGVTSNRSAIGTRVKIRATIEGSSVWQMREVSARTSFSAQNSLRAHFGLSDATVVDSLVLEWPSGIVQVMENVGVDQFLIVSEPCCEGRVGDANGLGQYPDEVTLADIMLLVDAKFISGDCNRLPCLAEADVNQDGGANPNCDDHVTLADIMMLVDFLFITGPENTTLPECP